jgi:alginate O-acetyltransferase complex protein AlgI
MNAPSFEFLGFALIGAVIFNLSSALAWRRWVVLALNLIFFAFFVPSLIAALPYVAFLGIGYIAIVTLRAKPSTGLFLLFLGLLLLSFFYLKRYSFIPGAITLPFVYSIIGLSYVFFRVLHLVIDVHQKTLTERISPLAYLNYTLHFPALISGPIQMYPDFKRNEAEPPPLDIFAIGNAALRIVTGFFKVVIVSVLLLKCQQIFIADLAQAASLPAKVGYSALIGAIYPLFLYANFSGYTDFVIGIARLYRFKLPENFDNPFVAENFIAFWSRWHITLSNWLKTYVYTPLLITLMRRFSSRTLEPYFGVLAYFVTFFLVGAWHGQTATFLFFGVLQGGGVAANKLYQVAMTSWLGRKPYRALGENPLYRILSRGLTFTWFAFTLLWFRLTWAQIGELVTQAGVGGFVAGWLLVWLVASILLAGLVALQNGAAKLTIGGEPIFKSRYALTIWATAMALATVAAVTLVAGPAPDIVYKNF